MECIPHTNKFYAIIKAFGQLAKDPDYDRGDTRWLGGDNAYEIEEEYLNLLLKTDQEQRRIRAAIDAEEAAGRTAIPPTDLQEGEWSRRWSKACNRLQAEELAAQF